MASTKRARWREEHVKPAYYFAYGSNLSLAQMKRRCPSSVPLCKMTLPGYRLEIKKFCDVVKDPESSVDGAIYWLSPQDHAALDGFEGVPYSYKKRWTKAEIEWEDGTKEVVDILFYTMVRERDTYTPTESYFQTCLNGCSDWNIDTDQLERALDEALSTEPELPELELEELEELAQ